MSASLTTRALVFDWDGRSLVALGFLSLTVIVVRPTVPAAQGPVGAVTDDALTRAVGCSPAVEANAVKAAVVPALVWKGPRRRERLCHGR